MWRSLLFVAIGLAAVPRPASALEVVVGIPPLAWIVEQLGGDRVEVEILLPAGASPETWQPSDAGVGRLLRADAYLRIGVDLEQGRWIHALANHRGLTVVDLVQRDSAEEPGDPHVWTSPALVRQLARRIHAGLRPLDPGGEATWDTGLEQLERRLTDLESDLRARLAPYAGRSFLVYHPAWAALADAMGLRQESVETDGKQPSDHRLTELRRAARTEGWSVLYTDPRTSGPSAARAGAAIGLELAELDPLPRDLEGGLRRAVEQLIADFTADGGRR